MGDNRDLFGNFQSPGQDHQNEYAVSPWQPEPVFLNVSGAQESILRNEFRQPIKPGGPVR